MEAVFLKLLNMSITASWFILAVIVLRMILKKAPKWIRCLLWALVAFRLICPFTFESILSLIPSAETVPQDIMYVQKPVIQSGVSMVNNVVNPVLAESFSPNVGDSVNPLQVVTLAAAVIWIVGLSAMIIYVAFSYIRIRRKVAASMAPGDEVYIGDDMLKERIYICDYIDTPFILGIIRPRIYLPSALDEEKNSYVIAHEKAHIKRRDHWWKPLGFVLLSVYWFNPFIWLAYILLCRDIELACDEKVIKELGETEKKSYSEALLFCSVPRKMIVACPLAFGEVGVKERVRTILNYKKPAFWVMVTAVAVCIIVAVCFLTNPKEELLHAPEPFGHSYYVEELVYDAPEYNSIYPMDESSLYSFTSDYVMTAKGRIDVNEAYEDWVQLGWMREVDLKKSNFDDYFRDVDGISGWMSGVSAASFRRDNAAAWELIDGDDADEETRGIWSYYLLQQENGDVYLACLNGGAEGEANPYSDNPVMRWVLKLARADYVTCTVRTPGVSAFFDMEWYPDGQFDFQYEDLPVAVVDTEGMLVFNVEGDCDTLTVGEDYYLYSSGTSGEVARETYTLKRDANGVFTLDIGRKNDVRGEYAVYYVPYEGGKYVFKVEFPEKEEGEILGARYVSSECLYMTLISSTAPVLGESYRMESDAFVVIDNYYGTEEWIAVEKWEWQQFPYTDEEWSEMVGFTLDGNPIKENISSRYEEMLYQPLSVQCFLLKMDGELWFVRSYPEPNGQERIWSIYSIVPEEAVTGDAITLSGVGDAGTIESADPLEAAIRDAVLARDMGEEPDGLFHCESHVIFETEIKRGTFMVTDGEQKQLITVYAMVLEQTYGFSGGAISDEGGSHMPVAITFEVSEDGEYTLVEYWTPWDGSGYEPSIREKFPDYIEEDAMDTQKYIRLQIQECYEQAVEYSGIDTDAVVAGLLKKITDSPSISSALEPYIQNNYVDYRELTYYGKYTLQYCFKEFLKGGQTDLRGLLMAGICQEIGKGFGEGMLPDIEPESGQAWFDEFREHAESLTNHYTSGGIRLNYPVSWMLLEMTETEEDAANPGGGFIRLPEDGSFEPIERTTMISSYGENDTSAEYRTPENGMFAFSAPLQGALAEYGDDVLYRVVVEVYSEEQLLETNTSPVEKERERLGDLGYTVAYETYNDGTSNHNYFTLHASKEQLENFAAGEEYGYMLFLYDECVR